MNWQSWIGKKHVTGADPVYDDGCDCLLMVTRIREHLGLVAPDAMDVATMILLAKAEAFREIHTMIAPHLVPVLTANDGAFTVFETPDQIGTAVMIDGGLLHVSHKRGVRWLPGNLLRKFDWYDWK
jgi:hypothetical protein